MFSDSALWRMKPDNSGVEFAFADEIIESYNELFSRIFPNINLDPNTPQGQIISYLAEQDLATISAIQSALNYQFMGGNGSFLDIWAFNNYRAKRKQGVNGSVVIDIQGVAGATIKKGFKVGTADGLYTFTLDKDIKLNEKGKAQATFIADSISENITLKNTITEILTPDVNVERVNNPNSSTAGILTESDSAFYARCQQKGSLFKNSSFASILASVANINGVSKLGGYENATNQEVTERNFQIDPHSFVIIVQGGDDTEIAKTISLAKPPGAGMMGDTEVKLTINDKDITYKFQRPQDAPFKVEVNTITDKNSPDNYKETIKRAVIEYFALLDIGADITQPALARAIMQVANGFVISDVKVGRKSSSTGYSPIKLNLAEIATITESDITIG